MKVVCFAKIELDPSTTYNILEQGQVSIEWGELLR